jgi:group I intron endonuclease
MILYLLTNTVNGKMYVGKTVSNNLNRYLSVKRWQAKNGHIAGMPVVASIAKHGWDKFSVATIAIVTNRDHLHLLEKLWIIGLDTRNPEKGYNVCRGGDLGRIGLQNSDEHNRKIGAANKGRKPKGYIRTEEHRRQLRERMKGNNRGVKLTPDRAKEYLTNETPEQKAARFAAIKRAWDSYTPEQRAARIEKMRAGRKVGC